MNLQCQRLYASQHDPTWGSMPYFNYYAGYMTQLHPMQVRAMWMAYFVLKLIHTLQ